MLSLINSCAATVHELITYAQRVGHNVVGTTNKRREPRRARQRRTRGATTFLVALQRDHDRVAVDYSHRVNNPG